MALKISLGTPECITQRTLKIRVLTDIRWALIVDRMYKGKLKDGDLDKFTPEQIEEMKAICKERHQYFVDMYEVVNAIGY